MQDIINKISEINPIGIYKKIHNIQFDEKYKDLQLSKLINRFNLEYSVCFGKDFKFILNLIQNNL